MKIRDLAIALLKDEEGINTDAWDVLRYMLTHNERGEQIVGHNDDIVRHVRIATNGRWYLPDYSMKLN